MTQVVYWILALCISTIMAFVGIATFAIGRKKGTKETEEKLKKDGYEEGIKDANIKNALDNLAKTIEDYAKDSVRQAEFKVLEQRVVAIEKNIFPKVGIKTD